MAREALDNLERQAQKGIKGAVVWSSPDTMADSQIMEGDVCDGLQRLEVGHKTEEEDETTQERRWISQ